MATSQKKGSSAKKTPANSNRAKSSGRKPATSKTAAKNAKAVKGTAAKSNNRQMGAILLFAVALFLLFVTLIPGGNVWLVLQNVFFGLFGVCAYVVPLLLFYVAIMTSLDKDTVALRPKILEAVLLIWLICAAVYVFAGDGAVANYGEAVKGAYLLGKDSFGGGAVGAVLGAVLLLLFGGKVPAGITLIILAFVVLMIISGTTLRTLWEGVQKPAQAARDATQDRYEERQLAKEERRLQRQEELEQMREQRKALNTDIDLGPAPKKRRGTKKPEAEDITFQKEPRSSIDIPLEEAPAQIKKDGTVTGANLDAIVKKAAEPRKREETPPAPKASKKPKLSEEEPFDVEAAKEMEQTLEEASKKNEEQAHYRLPTIDLLNPPKLNLGGGSEDELRDNAQKLVDVLQSFGVKTTLVDIARGPSVTRYELSPAAGVKLSKITGLSDDIALNLAASGVRIAPIPGKTAVGIEVPNKTRDAVNLREVLESSEYRKGAEKSKLSVALGKDISGKICTMDIAKMPHLLIAGTTGSGKSVCVNAMILSILYNAAPDEVKLVMIDPKKVEFSKYNGIPHLLVPVVTEPAKAAGSLQWAVREMLNRYQRFSDTGVRDIKGYNEMAAGNPEMEAMPQIVIFIDELADLMMATPKEVEDSICRLAQMARAAGMHMVIATQRPSVDVITGLIKANIPSRLSLYVASAVDSRTILDMVGAEKLLGNGDLLFNPVGVSKPTRIQGCFSTDQEVERVVDFIKGQSTSDYDEKIIEDINAAAAAAESSNQKGGGVNAPAGESGGDDLFEEAVRVVLEAGQASTSMLQRKLGVGYARAGRIIDDLEAAGIIGEYQGSKPRQLLITKQQWLERNALSDNEDDGTAAAIELGLED